jgi:hypothetical protein
MGLTDHLPLLLRWDGRRGIAKARDVVMTLCAPPPLGFRFVEIDFAPGACTLVRRRAWDALDDLLPSEIAACRAFLSAMDSEPPDLSPDC